ncbi:MAG: putative cathepsin B2 cysteine protease, partial [Streblomastix strix]
MLLILLIASALAKQLVGLISNDLPDSFDSRSAWPDAILPVRDKGGCSADWAFAVVDVLGDALGIKGCSQGYLSAQQLLSCDSVDQGCTSGTTRTALNYLFTTKGIATEKCIPYISGSGRVPACSAQCSDKTEVVHHKVSNITLFSGTEEQIRADIMQYGPATMSFDGYEDFLSYKSGVYKHRSGKAVGTVSVIVIGWGIENGEPYWFCQNALGKSWGEQVYYFYYYFSFNLL